jgi:hypothetical protein
MLRDKLPEEKKLDAILRIHGQGTDSVLACGWNECLSEVIELLKRTELDSEVIYDILDCNLTNDFIGDNAIHKGFLPKPTHEICNTNILKVKDKQ